MKKINEKGRSMLEMLGVLAIVGVLTIGGYNLVMKANTNRQANTVLDETGSFVTKVRNMARMYSGADKNISEEIYNGQAYPAGVTYDSTKKLFASTTDVEYKVYSAKEQKLLYIVEIADVDEAICMELVNTNWGSPSTTGFIGMSVVDAATSTFNEIGNAIKNGVGNSTNIGIVGNSTHPAPFGIGTATNVCAEGKKVRLAFR